MIAAIDTNVLLDVLLSDETFFSTSKALLDWGYAQGALVVSEVVYAELACQFSNSTDLDQFLSDTNIHLLPSNQATLCLAGQLWRAWRQKQGTGTRPGRRVLADFLVGAHALTQADSLLSRDRGFYRDSFSGLQVLDKRP